MNKAEWKQFYNDAVLYRIYPKSFYDADGDGIGDLRGVTEQIPYIRELGADGIILTSLFETDKEEVSYATTDFSRINPALGTIEDFADLIENAHASEIKVFLSLSILSTSTAHSWFEKSTSSLAVNPYKEYYIWVSAKDTKGKNPPNSDKNLIGESAWTYHKATHAWYRNTYGDSFPALNYDNPRIRREIAEVFRFWLEKGVDGFFIENACFSMNKLTLSDLKPMYKVDESLFDTGAFLYRILLDVKEKLADKTFPLILNAENTLPTVYPYLLSGDKPIADSVCAECVLKSTQITNKKSFSKKPFLGEYVSTQSNLASKGITLALEDGDHTRLISRFAKVGDPNYAAAAKFLATLLLTANATPVLYQGEEIGMPDFSFRKKTESLHFIKSEYLHSRAPYQWDNKPNAGFSVVYPYLPISDTYHRINAASQAVDPNSILSYYKRLIEYRKASSALKTGSFEDHSKGEVIAFIRASESEKLLVIANSSDKHINYAVPTELFTGDGFCDFCNYGLVSKPLHSSMGLRPFEIRIFRLKAPLLALN